MRGPPSPPPSPPFREGLGIVLLALLCVPSLVAEQAMHGGATTRSGLAWIYHDGVVYRQTADEDAEKGMKARKAKKRAAGGGAALRL